MGSGPNEKQPSVIKNSSEKFYQTPLAVFGPISANCTIFSLDAFISKKRHHPHFYCMIDFGFADFLHKKVQGYF